ncbi:aspartate carbamoyltransferase [Caldisphaera lagunensis DSM 15908]|uniref:Aspartate carbamoyltransferase n=1 Tax=Caldisphaera lagunensis (strain DSM 15908 / JCM 11604 / ANMR 0165 / IC-154) TaxID=1056495 RepID=L0AA21_CALLD|nr:aspartate carbamoyltransferase [Caldisphaera lagunensis]AFZ70748.1 aspartate carbamoyltransferase [Caldisphaera lagunensis DSM 15908]
MVWSGHDVVNVLDFNREDLELLFSKADDMRKQLKENHVRKILSDKIIGLAFFEPSTRTRMSFETAAKRLGAETVGFTGEEGTSVAKGESFADTIKMLDSYVDAIVLRHKYEGAALFAADVAEHPIINGGDGRSHHPTQAFLDLYTTRTLFDRIDGLTFALVGDLKYSRTVSSLIFALSMFKPKEIILISPPQLGLREEIKLFALNHGLKLREEKDISVISDADVIYVTRIQKERFPDLQEYEKVRGSYKITKKLLETYAKKTAKVLHPLPRVDELSPDVDKTSYQGYFTQASLGVPLRMALLSLVLGGE